MDLIVNNETMFTGQPCFNLVYVGRYNYLAYTGGFFFYDTQGSLAPQYAELNSRFVFLYNDAVTNQIPVQAVANQTLTAILDGQNVQVNLYELPIDTAKPAGSSLPVGADEGYVNQAFLAPYDAYVVSGYWDPGYSV